MRNHRGIKLVTSDKRRKCSDYLMAIVTKKTRVKLAKRLYLGMSILDIGKILMYEFWYDYINRKYGARAKFCYTDIGRLDEQNKGVIFRNCAPFTKFINRVNNTDIDNAQDIDIVIPMHNLIEYSDNY